MKLLSKNAADINNIISSQQNRNTQIGYNLWENFSFLTKWERVSTAYVLKSKSPVPRNVLQLVDQPRALKWGMRENCSIKHEGGQTKSILPWHDVLIPLLQRDTQFWHLLAQQAVDSH